MQFLLFNIAVGAAIFYLLLGDPGVAARKFGLPTAAVSTIDDLSKKAKQVVAVSVTDALAPESPKSTDKPRPSQVSQAAGTVSKKIQTVTAANYVSTRPVHRAPAPVDTPKVSKAIPEPVSTELSKRRTEVIGHTAVATNYMPTRPEHRAPAPVDTPKVSKAVPEPVSTKLSKRRTEVIGHGKPDSKFSLQEGVEMMTPRERYRELSKLVDDMELVYFNSLDN